MNTIPIPRYYIRCFSTSCVPRKSFWPKSEYGPKEVQRTTLMNGITVASAKADNNQMGACTIMFQAGSRYEFDSTRGVSHFLRTCSCSSGCGYSPFSKMRVLQKHGCYITVNNDRQSIAYTLRCPPCVFEEVEPYFLDIAARCCYKQYEVNWRKPHIKRDWHRSHPRQRAIDLVQKACWGGPLTNSVFCEPAFRENMTAEAMNWFISQNFRSDGCSVASVGLPFEQVLLMAEKVEITREKPPTPRSVAVSYPRSGFEISDMGPGSDTWVALGVPGCGNRDLKCLMTYSMLAAAIGTDEIQRGQHKIDRAPQSPVGALSAKDIYTDFKAFNISYCENGIFGILVKAPSASVRAAAFCAAGFLKSLTNLTCNHIEVGRRRLKVDMLLHDGNCTRFCEGLALQANECLHIDTGAIAASLLDEISANSVLAIASEVACRAQSQMALGAVGDEQEVPHNCELMSCLA